MSLEVGQRIKKIRLSKGHTMKKFSELLNASKGGVNNWEKGRHVPSPEKLKKIAELGEMSVDELLNGKQKPTYVYVVVHHIDREPKAVFTTFESAEEWATEVYGEQYTKYFEITIEQFTLED